MCPRTGPCPPSTGPAWASLVRPPPQTPTPLPPARPCLLLWPRLLPPASMLPRTPTTAVPAVLPPARPASQPILLPPVPKPPAPRLLTTPSPAQPLTPPPPPPCPLPTCCRLLQQPGRLHGRQRPAQLHPHPLDAGPGRRRRRHRGRLLRARGVRRRPPASPPARPPAAVRCQPRPRDDAPGQRPGLARARASSGGGRPEVARRCRRFRPLAFQPICAWPSPCLAQLLPCERLSLLPANKCSSYGSMPLTALFLVPPLPFPAASPPPPRCPPPAPAPPSPSPSPPRPACWRQPPSRRARSQPASRAACRQQASRPALPPAIGAQRPQGCPARGISPALHLRAPLLQPCPDLPAPLPLLLPLPSPCVCVCGAGGVRPRQAGADQEPRLLHPQVHQRLRLEGQGGRRRGRTRGLGAGQRWAAAPRHMACRLARLLAGMPARSPCQPRNTALAVAAACSATCPAPSTPPHTHSLACPPPPPRRSARSLAAPALPRTRPSAAASRRSPWWT